MSDNFAVEARDLSKRFGKIWALNRLSLSVRIGETYGLLGPNGSGKTTLIRTFIGIVKPNSGTIRLFGGQSLHKSVLSQIGYTPQSEALYQDLTVRENVT